MLKAQIARVVLIEIQHVTRTSILNKNLAPHFVFHQPKQEGLTLTRRRSKMAGGESTAEEERVELASSISGITDSL